MGKKYTHPPGFNTTLVQLKVQANACPACSCLCFNTTLVQLKAGEAKCTAPSTTSFNTTLVQLKVSWKQSLDLQDPGFNTTLVQLKARPAWERRFAQAGFQYHSGPIKSHSKTGILACIAVSIPLWSN